MKIAVVIIAICALYYCYYASYLGAPAKWKEVKLFAMNKGEVRTYLGEPKSLGKFWSSDFWFIDHGFFQYRLNVLYDEDDYVKAPKSARVCYIVLRCHFTFPWAKEKDILLPFYEYEGLRPNRTSKHDCLEPAKK